MINSKFERVAKNHVSPETEIFSQTAKILGFFFYSFEQVLHYLKIYFYGKFRSLVVWMRTFQKSFPHLIFFSSFSTSAIVSPSNYAKLRTTTHWKTSKKLLKTAYCNSRGEVLKYRIKSRKVSDMPSVQTYLNKLLAPRVQVGHPL